MIRNRPKHKAVAITSYCDTEKKKQVLISNISQLRELFSECDIVLHANYPLGVDIQKLVDSYIYEDLNYTGDNKWIYFWNIITENDEYLFQKKFYYSMLDTGFSSFQQIKSLTELLYVYDNVLLLNYDTRIDKINKNDYNLDYPFIGHYFAGRRAFSMLIMSFNPKIFIGATNNFTIENWEKTERIDQLNEERFFDIIKEAGIPTFGHDHKVPDIIDNRPDHNKPNVVDTRYFTNYVLYQVDNTLEIYIWGVTDRIQRIKIVSNTGKQYNAFNKSGHARSFQSSILLHGENITEINVIMVNDKHLDPAVRLPYIKGFEVRDI